MDELNRQLIGKARQPFPVAPGAPTRYDFELVRNVAAKVFIFYEILAERRELLVTARRTRVDWAHAIRTLVAEYYPEGRKNRVGLG